MTDNLKKAFYEELTAITTLSAVSAVTLPVSLGIEMAAIETFGHHIPVNATTIISFVVLPFIAAAYANMVAEGKTAQFRENMTASLINGHDRIVNFFSKKNDGDANIPR